MLRVKNDNIDLALANWLVTAEVPQFRDVTRQAYFKQLDAMTEQVRTDMARKKKIAEAQGANPGDPDTRCGIFCSSLLKLRFSYTEEFRHQKLTPAHMRALYRDANNLFLVGLLRTGRGSCVSMPLIYLVIGRRLGLPVHLVAIGKHYFVRWEEPGYRMNIETTTVDKVWVTEDDAAHLEVEGLTREQLKGSDLRNLTHREVVGQLFFTRSGYWGAQGPERQTQMCLDLSRARHLSPDDPGISAKHQLDFTHYGIKPEHKSIEIRITPKQ